MCSLGLLCYCGHCYCGVSVVMDLFDQRITASVHWRTFAVPLWSARPCRGRWGGSARPVSGPLYSRSKELAPASMPSSSRGSSTTQTESRNSVQCYLCWSGRPSFTQICSCLLRPADSLMDVLLLVKGEILPACEIFKCQWTWQCMSKGLPFTFKKNKEYDSCPSLTYQFFLYPVILNDLVTRYFKKPALDKM